MNFLIILRSIICTTVVAIKGWLNVELDSTKVHGVELSVNDDSRTIDECPTIINDIDNGRIWKRSILWVN